MGGSDTMTEKNDNILEINDLHVVYDTDEAKVYAVNDLNLNVKKKVKP